MSTRRPGARPSTRRQPSPFRPPRLEGRLFVTGLGAPPFCLVEATPVLVNELGIDLSVGQSRLGLALAGLSLGFVLSSRVGAPFQDAILALCSQTPRFARCEVDSAKLTPGKGTMLLGPHLSHSRSVLRLREVGGRVRPLGVLTGTSGARKLTRGQLDLPVAKQQEGVERIFGRPHDPSQHSARPPK